MELIRELLFQTYQFLASIDVPGFDVSFIQLFLGVTGIALSIGFARMFFGLGGNAITILSHKNFSQKGGNNKNIKISKERKGDSK